MRKILLGVVAAGLLAFGLGRAGEAATKEVRDCINQILFPSLTGGKAQVVVVVGSTHLWVTPDGRMTAGVVAPSLTYAELAAFEPILATLRAGAAARVKLHVMWDDSTTTKRVYNVRVLFGERC